MDLTYDEVEVNDCFYIKQNNKVRKIIITAKLKYILFYTILNSKRCGYIDCGASSSNPNYLYKAVPKNTISCKGNSTLLDRYIYLESTSRDRGSSYINKKYKYIMTQLELIKALQADLEKFGVRQVAFVCDDYYYNGIIKNVYSGSDEEACILSV